MARFARNLDLVLHIGLHKTATSYLQNVLGAVRYDLMDEGILYPMTGLVNGANATRDGAQSGHAMFTRKGRLDKTLVPALVEETPDSCSTILMSSENFTLWHRPLTPADYLARFKAFRSVRVVLVLRRQDEWIESYYKQIVDGYRDFETRSFGEFLEQEGAELLDFHTRFTPWRDLVGPDQFHVLSYDDLGAAGVCREVIRLAGSDGSVVDRAAQLPLPRYDSVRAIDTLGLRILNSYRLPDRDARIAVAQAIAAVAPKGDLTLMTPQMRAGIQEVCTPINERIESEWFGRQAVPGLRFAESKANDTPAPPAPEELAAYFDAVIGLCEQARAAALGGADAEGGASS